LVDLYTANVVLDLEDDAQAEAENEAERKRRKPK
jgi:hypothetical protein